MLGKSLKRDIKDRLRASGLDSSGELGLFTDGEVVSHNATTVRPFPSKGPGYKLYTWKIQNLLAPTPSPKNLGPLAQLFPGQSTDKAGCIPTLAAHSDNFTIELINQCCDWQ